MSDGAQEPCPHSMTQDARGEVHPHSAGEWFVLGQRICSVCERSIRRGHIEEAMYRSEARAVLFGIVRRPYWLDPPTSSDPPPGSGGPTPPGGPRPLGRQGVER